MSGAIFDFDHYKELFEAMELEEAIDILKLAEAGIPSFESDLAINDLKDALATAVKEGQLSFRVIEGLASIAVCDIELLSRIFFPEKFK